MIKKLVLGAFIMVASFTSFQMGATGNTKVQGPTPAQACWPPDYPEDPCACGCCYECQYWGSYCPGC